MKKLGYFFVISIFIIAGCALKVIPVPVESGSINQKDSSQTVIKDGISVTVGGAETQLHNYNLESSVSAFSVLIDNQTNSEFSLDTETFLLIDNEGTQYFPLTPEKVKEILSRDSYYLIPYPYVGFYYLEDYEKSSFYNTFNSQLPYFYEVYPQDIYTKAIVAGTIIPKAKVSGLVYFKIDLSVKKAVKVLLYKKGTAKSAEPDFVFPFKIEK